MSDLYWLNQVSSDGLLLPWHYVVVSYYICLVYLICYMHVGTVIGHVTQSIAISAIAYLFG